MERRQGVNLHRTSDSSGFGREVLCFLQMLDTTEKFLHTAAPSYHTTTNPLIMGKEGLLCPLPRHRQWKLGNITVKSLWIKQKKGRQKQVYFLKNFNNKLYCIKECCGRKILKDSIKPLRKRGKKEGKNNSNNNPSNQCAQENKEKGSQVKTATSYAGQVSRYTVRYNKKILFSNKCIVTPRAAGAWRWVNSDASAL